MGNQVDLFWEEPCGRVSPLGEDLPLSLSDHSTRRMGRLAQVHVSENPPLDSEQGTPCFGPRGGWGSFTSGTKKSSKLELRGRVGRLEGGARCEDVEGPCSALLPRVWGSEGERNENLVRI